MKRNKIDREAQARRWRFETPPVFGTDNVKRKRWPPQYISPPPTPQTKKRRSNKPTTRNMAPKLPGPILFRSSSPELVSANPASPAAVAKPKRPKPLVSHKIPSLASCQRTKAVPTAPRMAPAAAAGFHRPTVSKPSTSNDVVFHFFLADETIGAIPITMAQCNTSALFFEQALLAWNFLEGDSDVEHMAAASVAIDCLQWPMVVPWRNSQAHKRMTETIAKAMTGRTGPLEVKVKCIQK